MADYTFANSYVNPWQGRAQGFGGPGVNTGGNTEDDDAVDNNAGSNTNFQSVPPLSVDGGAVGDNSPGGFETHSIGEMSTADLIAEFEAPSRVGLEGLLTESPTSRIGQWAQGLMPGGGILAATQYMDATRAEQVETALMSRPEGVAYVLAAAQQGNARAAVALADKDAAALSELNANMVIDGPSSNVNLGALNFDTLDGTVFSGLGELDGPGLNLDEDAPGALTNDSEFDSLDLDQDAYDDAVDATGQTGSMGSFGFATGASDFGSNSDIGVDAFDPDDFDGTTLGADNQNDSTVTAQSDNLAAAMAAVEAADEANGFNAVSWGPGFSSAGITGDSPGDYGFGHNAAGESLTSESYSGGTFDGAYAGGKGWGYDITGTELDSPADPMGNNYDPSAYGGAPDGQGSGAPGGTAAAPGRGEISAGDLGLDDGEAPGGPAAAPGAGSQSEGAMGSGTGNPDGVDDADAAADDGGTVICTELHRQGMIPKKWWEADERTGVYLLKEDPDVLIGYHAWAKPVASLMARSMVMTFVAAQFGIPWAREMYVMQEGGRGTIRGKLCVWIGVPVCRLIGKIIRLTSETKESVNA
jgi:hypothetical protein